MTQFQAREEDVFGKHYLLLNEFHQRPSYTSPPALRLDSDRSELPVVYTGVVPPRTKGRLIQLLVSGDCLQRYGLSSKNTQASETGE